MHKAIKPRSRLNFTPAELSSAYRWLCQQRNKKATSNEMDLVLGDRVLSYVKRWRRWCTAGLSELNVSQIVDEIRRDRVGPGP